MEKRIELERRARKANQITELNLDNCRSTSIVGFTDEYTALESLSLINVGLTTLKGFPKLPNLKKLELSDNRISSGLNYLTTSPKLQYLNLSGNKIKDLETLKPLQEFKNLEVLDLFNNDATWVANYREKIFKMLPSLNFLDGFDCNEEEAQSEGDDDEEVNGNDSEEEGLMTRRMATAMTLMRMGTMARSLCRRCTMMTWKRTIPTGRRARVEATMTRRTLTSTMPMARQMNRPPH
ncbi:acidic leucine-rich nuclear phosphoprotein 32 family member A isoform X4 [Drosophila guanche]|uniref:acidic leucine-rich nuclear phosphoprotein 32 family member A isoform X4 n=1 Tax=Drosophila guanche TaxID=7266 RepID=UPI0014722E57|nr:acidic leucine-rich nuclear phosphoprotein 32 family member A isoform X4 [Drosophila guanche]